MSQALLSAFVVLPRELRVVEISAETRGKLEHTFRDRLLVHESWEGSFTENDLVILAVKPQVMDEVCTSLTIDGATVASIAAGIPLNFLADKLKTNQVVRAMPNLASSFNLGITGIFGKSDVRHKEEVIEIFRTAGTVLTLDDEDQINAITAISGSGTAYVMYFIESLIEAAQSQGFDLEASSKLATQVFSGAIELLNRSNNSPAELRKQVTSKGGTTAAAISSMEKDSLKTIVARAVNAAYRRSIELSN